MRRFPDPAPARAGLMILLGACLISATGCGRRPTLAPVSGRVTLDGRPLAFGSVMIQPTGGPAARGRIERRRRITFEEDARTLCLDSWVR